MTQRSERLKLEMSKLTKKGMRVLLEENISNHDVEKWNDALVGTKEFVIEAKKIMPPLIQFTGHIDLDDICKFRVYLIRK